MLANKRKLADDADAPQSPRRTKSRTEATNELDTQQDAASTAKLSELKTLLDLSELTSRDDISSRFDAIADMLLNHIVLRLHGRTAASDTALVAEYEIMELEFYLYKAGCHEDPFTHGTEEQRKSGRWYFHRAPRRDGNVDPTSTAARTSTAAGGYRGGTRKGLDLTFGGPVGSSPVTSRFFTTTTPAAPPTQGSQRGGILLRTIRRRADHKLFSGPSLLVDELLRASGAPTIVALVNDVWADLDAFPPAPGPALRLHAAAHASSQQVYRSPRIGLDLAHTSVPVPTAALHTPTLAHPRTAFVSRRYRYFVQPSQLTANGRGHTFLGVHDALAQAERDEGALLRALADATGLKHPTAMKYLDAYRAGKDCSLRQFVGAQGKGAGSSPIPFLRMLGCLDHLQNESM